ncbi:MAG: FAD-dependent oxidoreductase, partial [Oscillospiraceae bacterium]
QFNCTSGYEEAAAQGIVAGINAARKIQGKSPVILERSTSYIGTLIDDLVTKGCSEPYRMMTSRSEFRLILRQDNAPERLLPLGHEVGLVSEERWERFLEDDRLFKSELERIKKVTIHPTDELNKMLVEKGTSPITAGIRLFELLKRPQLAYTDFEQFDAERPKLKISLINRLETELKYAGYIKIQAEQIEKARKLEQKTLPVDVDYREIKGLRLEAQEKLNKHKPLNVGQAGRISGVNPADVSVLLIWLAGKGGKND